MINSFRDQYAFLSNFYPCTIKLEGFTYTNAEAAFQAMKCLVPDARKWFQDLDGAAAKRMGRNVMLRKDWNTYRITAMEQVLEAKFRQNWKLGDALVFTLSEELVEGNNWGDTFWGVCNGVGVNMLGKLLMKLREKLAAELDAANKAQADDIVENMSKPHVYVPKTEPLYWPRGEDED